MRQKLRKALLFISFFLFPVSIFYLSPVLIIEGASKGIVVGSFVVFALLFFSSLLFGRVFCSWICPAGGLQEICFAVNNKKARGGRGNWIKYFIWVPWLTLIILMILKAGGLKQINVLYQMDYSLPLLEPRNYIIYYFFVMLIAIMAFVGGRRAFCHYVCWIAPFMVIGTKIKDLFSLPSIHLEADSDRCTKCKVCTKNCPMSLEVDKMAQEESMKNSECILCGECVDGCMKGAIRYSFWVPKTKQKKDRVKGA